MTRHYKPWLTREERILREKAGTMDVRQLTAEYFPDRTTGAVRMHAVKMGISTAFRNQKPKGPRTLVTEAEIEQVAAAIRENGLGGAREELGIPSNRFSAIVRRGREWGMIPPSEIRHGAPSDNQLLIYEWVKRNPGYSSRECVKALQGKVHPFDVQEAHKQLRKKHLIVALPSPTARWPKRWRAVVQSDKS